MARLVDQIGQGDRVLKQARLLPSGPLTDDDIAGVRSDYRAYTSKHGQFDRQVADEIGVDKDALTAWRKGATTGAGGGEVEKLTRAANDWMERDARRREVKVASDYVPTRVAEEISAIVNVACAAGCMAAIVAPSGIGKTMLLQVLADRTRGRYLYADETATPRQFLANVAQAVEARGVTQAPQGRLMRAVVDKLKGTNRPLFIDEAHRLPPDVLPRIRSIHDQAGVPIVMAGTHEILHRINDRSEGRGQFASRCIQYNVMEHIIDAEGPTGPGPGGEPGGGPGTPGAAIGRPLFSKQEIEQFLNGLRVRFDTEALDLLWSLACLPNHGCLRLLQRIVSLLRPNRRQRETEPLTRREILTSLALLFGAQGKYLGQIAGEQRRVMEAA